MDGSNTDVKWSDWFFGIYNAVLVILLLLMGNHVHNRWLYFLSNLALILLSVLLIRGHHSYPEKKVLRFFRHWYPFLYFFYLHWESGMVGDLLFQGSFDAIVAAWDVALFGDYLHDILYRFQPLWFSEFIHFTYSFYYLLLLAPAFYLYQVDFHKFSQYVFDVSLLYLLHYTLFYMFPVIGPIEYHYAKFPDGLMFIPLMKFLYIIGDSPGGAMPSSHVSVAILSWYWLYKITPVLAWMAAFLVLCLIFSTVYLSFHYAIDAVAGLLVGTLFVLLMHWLRKTYHNHAFI